MKFILIVIILHVAQSSVAESFNNVRIVGGDEAKPHQFPYQVGLYVTFLNNHHSFCGGSLISENYVLTAGHCVYKAKSIEVVLGAHKIDAEEDTQVRITSTDFKVHKNYNDWFIYNDIALVKLPLPVQLNDYISIVRLPIVSDKQKTFVDDEVTVSGWGMDSDHSFGPSSVLRYVRTKIITNLKCMLTYIMLWSSEICDFGANKTFCQGDSGGPLVYNDTDGLRQIGIVSKNRSDGCEKGHPSVYTRITSFLDWIQENSDIKIQQM